MTCRAMRLLALSVFCAFPFPAMASDPGEPPQGRQSTAQFAASYGANGVSNVSATAQKVSCYAPELTYFGWISSGPWP